MKTKIGIAKQYNPKGIALWRLGLVTPEMWGALDKTIETKKNKAGFAGPFVHYLN